MCGDSGGGVGGSELPVSAGRAGGGESVSSVAPAAPIASRSSASMCRLRRLAGRLRGRLSQVAFGMLKKFWACRRNLASKNTRTSASAVTLFPRWRRSGFRWRGYARSCGEEVVACTLVTWDLVQTSRAMPPKKRARTAAASASSSSSQPASAAATPRLTLHGGVPHHPSLVALWRDDRLTDFAVSAEGVEFKAHRVALASCS